MSRGSFAGGSFEEEEEEDEEEEEGAGWVSWVIGIGLGLGGGWLCGIGSEDYREVWLGVVWFCSRGVG